MIGFNLSSLAGQTERGNLAHPDYLAIAGKAQAFRYPAGTESNFWNWDTETLDEQDVISYGHENLLAQIEYQKSINNGELLPLHYSGFQTLINEKAAIPVIVLPLYNRNAREIISIIDTHRFQQTYWELGNELYNPDYEEKYSGDFVWNIDHYTVEARKIIDHIRLNYPEDKIGVCGWHFPDEMYDAKNVEAIQAWNQGVGSLDADAICLHPYIYYSDFYQALDDINRFPSIISNGMERDFPGKALWITEVNILDLGLTWERVYLLYLLYSNMAALNPEMILFHFLGDGSSELASDDIDGNISANRAVYEMIGL